MPDIYEVEHNGEIWEVEANSPEEAAATFAQPQQQAAPQAPQRPSVEDRFAEWDKTAAGLRSDAIEHPIRTGLSVGATALAGTPGILAKGLSKVAPLAGPAVKATGQALEQPLVGGTVGAAQGYNRGGLGGALEGGLVGMASGTLLGRALTALGTRMSPSMANAGGRLQPRSTPTVTESIDDALQSLRGPQPTSASPGIVHMPKSVKSVSLPDAGPGPSVTMSPKSQVAASGRVPPKRGSGSGGALDGNVDGMYRELARKPILTPEEQQTFDRLHAIISARASNMGRSYAAR